MLSKLRSLECQDSTQAHQGQMWEQDMTLTYFRIALRLHIWRNTWHKNQSLPTTGFWLHQSPLTGLSKLLYFWLVCLHKRIWHSHSTNNLLVLGPSFYNLSLPDSWGLSHISITVQHLLWAYFCNITFENQNIQLF